MVFSEQMKEYLFPLWEDKIVTLKGLIYKTESSIFTMSIPLFITYLTEYAQSGDFDSVIRIGVFFVFFALALFISVRLTKDWGRVVLRTHFEEILHKKYVKRYLDLPNNYTESLGTGKSLAIVSKGITIWGLSLKNLTSQFVDLSLALIFTLFILGTANIYYVFGFVFVLLVSVYFAYYFNSKVLVGRRNRKEVSILFSNHIVRLIMSKFEIILSGKWETESMKITEYSQKKIGITKLYSQHVLYMFFGNIVFLNIVAMLGLVFTALQVMNGTVDISVLAGMGAMFIVIISKIRAVLTFFKDFTKEWIHIEKLLDVCKSYNQSVENEGSSKNKFTLIDGTIDIQNLTYGYGDNLVFSGFGVHISGGKKTAFVGMSGSGKSTLVKLIAGYMKPQDGKILVDDQDIHTEISLPSYYKHIGYLTQEPSVFDGTIYDNLTYAIDTELFSKDEITKKVEQAISLSKCEFIYDFSEGLQTEIGERGVRLSGGQRQRLAIAKVILKDPSIIILDEPTSALDSFSEEAITQAMNNLFSGRTVIIIAHRLQTVKEADDIIVLGNERLEARNQKGEKGDLKHQENSNTRDELVRSPEKSTRGSIVIERGTHKELVEMGGYYAKMLEVQTGF